MIYAHRKYKSLKRIYRDELHTFLSPSKPIIIFVYEVNTGCDNIIKDIGYDMTLYPHTTLDILSIS